MADVINYWPDPQFRTTIGDTPFVAANMFPNPSPTVDLTGWAAVSGGSISRVAGGLFPDTTYKCRAVNGVTLTGADTITQNQGWTFTGKVKAVDAMTITISAAMADTSQPIIVRTVGWGSFGWGEALTYTTGTTKTFTAGEECLFRIYCGEDSPYSTPTGPSHKVQVTLSGTGTFDVDGITQWLGVDDGVNGSTPVPDAFPYFSGDTPDDANFTYEWYGTPHASASLQKAKKPKYAYSTYDMIFSDELPIFGEAAYAAVKDGTHRLALRSAIQFGHRYVQLYDGTVPTVSGYVRPSNKVGFNLPDGDYAITFDLVTDYQNYYYGSAEPEWGGGAYAYVQDVSGDWPQRLAYQWIPAAAGAHRTPVTLPFTVAGGVKVNAEVDIDLNWVSGDVFVENVGIFEIGAVLHRYDALPDGDFSCVWDMTALGVTAGKTYRSNVEVNRRNSHPVFESRVGTGAWTTLVESTASTTLTDDKYFIPSESFEFTVPSDATEVRLRLTGNLDLNEYGYGNGVGVFDLFEAPPSFFDGDTPDGGGFTYSWTGTPHDSTSVRSVASSTPAINAKVFVGGVAITVSEMRAVKGGVLSPVTEIGT